MSRALDTIFGLEAMRFGAEGVLFQFARPFPAWAWLLAVLAALAVAWWSYRRLIGSPAARWSLGALRGGLLLTLLLVISGPQLVRPNERVEKDWVLVLVDRSASMSIKDAPGAAGRRAREEQLAESIRDGWPRLAELAKERTVVWLGFDSGVYELAAPPGDQPPEIGRPSGRRTAIGAVLEQAFQRAAARPIAGVIVLSDGRSVDEPGRAVLRRLQSEHIPVLTVPLGSAEPVSDLAIVAAEAPLLAFVNDTVPVVVQVDRLGAPAQGRPPPSGVVRLIDRATGRVLDEAPLPRDESGWSAGRTRVVLTTRPDLPGAPTWTVVIVPDAPDLIEENNEAEIKPELVDRPLRVAYFDGYPRWEYRYLKNLLVREPSIRSASMLLASNRQYLQEGDVQLLSIPRSPEEWAAFDVIILGDLASNLFSDEQLEQLREHIAVRGAGLLWVGGPGATPSTWRDSPLADLLPFAPATGRAGDDSVRAWDESVVVTRAPGAERLGLLELGNESDAGWPPSLADPRTGWSALRYAQRIDPAIVKPTAEVLAWAHPLSAPGEESLRSPLVLTMRYGAGRVMYVATDEIWRWRYARGEALPERFWLPLMRLQGRESLARTARSALIEVTPRRAEVRQPVRVAVELLDQSIVDLVPSGATLTARIRRVDEGPRGEAGPERSAPIELTLAPEQIGARGSSRSFARLWTPDEAGKYRVEAIDPLLANLGLAADLEVALSDDELRHPETDHALLTRLSEQTEGRVLAPSDLASAPDLLPNREIRIAGTPDITTLWDKPAVLILLVLLLTLEWVGRRLIKLS